MYESYFGLASEPFSVAPDPRFMYLSHPHREALRQLEIGLRAGAGFVLLTGEIGAGKTTVWRSFLERLPPEFDVATVVNPRLDVSALLARICEDLGVDPAESPGRDPIDALHGHLLLAHARGRRTLIAVDEAQALSDEVFEQLRLLTNLVTGERKFVQVLLIGQPELLDRLDSPVLEPLAQRIVGRFHLSALPEDETRRYVAHRLAVAGGAGAPPFDDEALAAVHSICGGVPRRINVLCHRALLLASERRVPRVDAALVDQAALVAFGRPARPLAPQPPSGSPSGPPSTQDLPLPAATSPPSGPAHRRGSWWVGAAALGLGLVLSPWLRHWLAGPTPAPAVAAVPAVPAEPAPAAPPPAASAAAPPLLPAATAEEVLAGADDAAAAWRELAAAWGEMLPPAGARCAAAAAVGLPCWRGRGGLAAIRQLDRPVLLTLADATGRPATVVLTGLAEPDALLRVAGQARRVPLAPLLRDWNGEFTTLWRAPPGWREGQSVADESAPLAQWLAERLTPLDGRPQRPLADRITSFQRAQGLAPDGIAGTRTLMALNRATGVDEPRLERP